MQLRIYYLIMTWAYVTEALVREIPGLSVSQRLTCVSRKDMTVKNQGWQGWL